MTTESPTLGYMAVSDLKDIAANWQLYKGFTVRPLPSTEQFYRYVVEHFSDPDQKLMAYGGTPEIRTVIHDANRQAVIVDRAPVMVYAMGLLTSGEKPVLDNERVVQGDWLNMPFGKSFAHLAFGDDAVNMIKWESFDRYMHEAHRVLLDNGLFACHLLVQPEERFRRQSTVDVIREYEVRKIKSEFDLASRINFTFYDEETYQMGWQRSIAGLKRLREIREIDSIQGFIKRFENSNSIFACPPQQEWEKLIEPLFSIEEIFYPSEHDYCRFEPLYLLRKRT
ncbi:MAG TPA: class I SAM-dependent methyltransferase [Gammaproteobacteria bacterium]|nr:class I SAM-dependent methyltransferase [Gammaproteobacteria bacterium]